MRGATGAATLALALSAGCASGGSAPADYRQATAELVSHLEGLPGGTVTAHVTSSPSRGAGNVAVDAGVPATATAAELAALADQIERMIWTSRLNPLSTITINLRRPADTFPSLQREPSTEQLLTKYGARPGNLSP